MKKAIFGILLLLTITSCTESTQKEKRNELEKIVKHWIGKKIEMPDSIFILRDAILSFPKENPLEKENQKILTCISGDCEKCIYNLNDWVVFLDSINLGNKLQLVVIILSSDINQFVREFNHRIPPSVVAYFDIKFKFLTEYNFPQSWEMRTFLLDNHNKVVLIGNPLHNSTLKKLYLQKIKENEKTIF